ncbi:hypothetical protein Leryth_001905 [Lithospermum erythrorhizon]|nr:hypothetical protein Leryth_001905 [Lithospermum erythrorhizon]
MSNYITQKNNNGSQACAACKYQRRKCASDCLLAPYFPQNRQGQFINAHRLFGVSNITKIIRPLDQQSKDEAMRTIIFQSDVRATDPVGGCYRIIQDLQRQIDYYTSELEVVYYHLALCRFQETQTLEGHVQLSNNQQEQEKNNSNAQPHHQHHICLEDNIVDNNNQTNCEATSYSYDRNNYQHYYPDDNNITQSSQVLLEGINCWSPQEFDGSYVPLFRQQNCIITEGDDIRPLLDLPIDRVEFKFDLDQTTESQFRLEEEDKNHQG